MLLREGDLDAYNGRLVGVVSNIMIAIEDDENAVRIPTFIVEVVVEPPTSIGTDVQSVIVDRHAVVMEFILRNPSPIQFAGRLFPGVVAHRPVDREFIGLQSPRPLKIFTVVFNVSPFYSDFIRHPILTDGFCPLNAIIIGIRKLISIFGFVDCDMTSWRK